MHICTEMWSYMPMHRLFRSVKGDIGSVTLAAKTALLQSAQATMEDGVWGQLAHVAQRYKVCNSMALI